MNDPRSFGPMRKACHGRRRHPVPHRQHRAGGATKDSLIRAQRVAWRMRRVRADERLADREIRVAA